MSWRMVGEGWAKGLHSLCSEDSTELDLDDVGSLLPHEDLLQNLVAGVVKRLPEHPVLLYVLHLPRLRQDDLGVN